MHSWAAFDSACSLARSLVRWFARSRVFRGLLYSVLFDRVFYSTANTVFTAAMEYETPEWNYKYFVRTFSASDAR